MAMGSPIRESLAAATCYQQKHLGQDRPAAHVFLSEPRINFVARWEESVARGSSPTSSNSRIPGDLILIRASGYQGVNETINVIKPNG